MKTKKTALLYILFGGMNTFISLMMYWCMIKIGLNYLFSSSFVYVFGIIEGYIFTSLWVFNHKIKISSLIRYSEVYGISFIINIVLMYTMVDIFYLSKLISQIICTGILTIANYQMMKIYVFRKKEVK
ncbi:GtrA family protein [Francisella sp. SYW-2]|uniref:GtrA family protein n=1 Tax=Francisella sp. SYW-2 TaxID=2610886 RepID=UPI00398CD3A1